jgi:signal transduction histidine kinase
MAREDIPDEVKSQSALILNEELPESIHYITTSIAKMDNLLMGLLQISRLGRQESSIELLSMNILMQQVVDSYKYEIHKGLIEVVVKDLPRCYGDKDQINQLFSNLLGNALKFLSPERKGKIIISGKEEKKYARYSIKDNGIGIEKAHQKKIFEMFYKLDPNKPGSGLGMSIIKQIVEKNSGTIHLDSEYGKGTEITINLPIHLKKQ